MLHIASTDKKSTRASTYDHVNHLLQPEIFSTLARNEQQMILALHDFLETSSQIFPDDLKINAPGFGEYYLVFFTSIFLLFKKSSTRPSLAEKIKGIHTKKTKDDKILTDVNDDLDSSEALQKREEVRQHIFRSFQTHLIATKENTELCSIKELCALVASDVYTKGHIAHEVIIAIVATVGLLLATVGIDEFLRFMEGGSA